MLLILASWLVMATVFLVWGTAAARWTGMTVSGGSGLILGMVVQTLVLTICAFAFPLGIEVFIGNSVLTLLFAILYRKRLAEAISGLWISLRTASRTSGTILLIVVVTALWKSAQLPFIPDNDSYYIQTIKWLNEYGIVTGLANFNIAFGQTSGWHILQAGFDFSFIVSGLNDINGLLMVVFAFIVLTEEKEQRWAKFILLFNILLYQFVSSPSPDFPVILLLQLAFLSYLGNGNGKWIVVLTVYVVFLKLTAAPFLLLLLFPLLRKEIKWGFAVATGLVFFIPWTAKSLILSGYPAFPMTFCPIGADWTLPQPFAGSLSDMVYHHEFMAFKGYRNFSTLDRLSRWLHFGGISAVFNLGMLLLFALVPLLRWKDSRFKILYGLCIVHFIIILLTSPQYRFFLPEYVFLAAIVANGLADRLKDAQKNLIIAIFVLLPIVTPILLKGKTMTSNKNLTIADSFSIGNLWKPLPPTRYPDMEFELQRIDNIRYYSPPRDVFFYTTSDGPLPCTNQRIIRKFAKKYGVVPQLRSTSLKDGFRSIPASEWDKTN